VARPRQRPRHASRRLARVLHELPPPCCPQVPYDGAYVLAQGVHQRDQADDPDHDRTVSVCCCWDCRGWERPGPNGT
jgi:hypothetical protein